MTSKTNYSFTPKRTPNSPDSEVIWKMQPFLRLQDAARIAGISVASIYRFAGQERLQLRKLAGRTLVETQSFITLIESAEKWSPSTRGKEARAKRVELSLRARVE